MEAEDLELGDAILSLGGSYGTVEAILIEARSETMYDLTVESVHSFAVGEGDWVVHNTNPCNLAPKESGLGEDFQQAYVDVNNLVYDEWIGGIRPRAMGATQLEGSVLNKPVNFQATRQWFLNVRRIVQPRSLQDPLFSHYRFLPRYFTLIDD